MVVPAPAFDTENILGCPTHMDANFSSAFCRHQQGQRPGPRANDQDIEIAGFGDFFEDLPNRPTSWSRARKLGKLPADR